MCIDMCIDVCVYRHVCVCVCVCVETCTDMWIGMASRSWQAIADDAKVKRILQNSGKWVRDEISDRNRMLQVRA